MFSRLLVLTALQLLVLTPPLCGDDADDRPLDVRRAVTDTTRLDEILRNWSAATANVQTARTTYERYEYDHDFLTEKRSRGEIRFQAPDRILWKIEPVLLPEENKPAKVSVWGEQYHLTTERPVTWYVDRYEVLLANHDDRTFSRYRLPLHSGDFSVAPADPLMEISPETAYIREEGLLQYLFKPLEDMFGLRYHMLLTGSFFYGYKVGEFQNEFTWTIDRNGDEEIRLSGRPQNRSAATLVSRVDVILDPETYRTKAVRFIDPGGSKQTVYVIQETDINDPTIQVRPPRLTGYKLQQTATRGDITPTDEPAAASSSSNPALFVAFGFLLAILLCQ